MRVQFLGTSFLGPFAIPIGGAILSHSESGRYVLAAEIIATAAVATVACGGTCSPAIAGSAKGAFIGATTTGALGGYSASVNGGNISQGVLFGTTAGAIVGGIGGAVNAAFPAPAFDQYALTSAFGRQLGECVLGNLGAGTLINAASGATVAYAGGESSFNTIRSGAFRAVTSGVPIEAALTALGLGVYGFAGTNYGTQIDVDVVIEDFGTGQTLLSSMQLTVTPQTHPAIKALSA